MNQQFLKAVRAGNRNEIERLINSNEINPSSRDSNGNSPLHIAVEIKRNEIFVITMLLQKGFSPNDQNAIGATPLHFVTLRKDSGRQVAQLLIENGADPNIPMHSGHTALHLACEKHKVELVQLFCQQGASAVAIDSNSNSPLHITLKAQGRDTIAKDIIEILMRNGNDPKTKNNEGNDGILLAAIRGYSRVATYLIQRGAVNPRTTNLLGNTIIHEASANGHSEIIELLLTLDSQLINAKNHEGNTPLHLAAINNHPDVAITLIRKGASGHVKNGQGKVPYDFVSQSEKDIFEAKHPDIVRTLSRKLQTVVKPKRAECEDEEDGICLIF